MNARTLAIVLGTALAVSVAVNLFAATAAYTVMTGQDRLERRLDRRESGNGRPAVRDILAELDPGTRRSVRQALREAGAEARPDFLEARWARRDAAAAAAAQPYDAARVAALLEQSRTAEARGRARLEADTLTILGTLEPDDRAAFAQLLTGRGRSGRDRSAPADSTPGMR